MSKLQLQVAEFMRLFDQTIEPAPTVPSRQAIALRARLIVEETFELLEALYGAGLPEWSIAQKLVGDVVFTRDPRVDLAAFAGACGDLDYVVEGARLAFGIDGGPIADAIHKANMAKVGGEVRDGKRLKPAQWTPPDIEGELVKQTGESSLDAVLGAGSRCACGRLLGDVIWRSEGVEACSEDCLYCEKDGLDMPQARRTVDET